MIRINKPSTAPTILTADGATETKSHCDEYERKPRGYRNGTKTFDFKRAIYADDSVKAALVKAQHGKCAFCESRITHDQPGDVEHFRPKKGIARGKSLSRPGYYWLAYDWDNLLFACALCNRRHKRNSFPLLRGSQRGRSHLDSVSKEQPLFIYPANEAPESMIGFRAHIPYARGGNIRARQTIEELGLKRKELMEVRAKHLARLRLLVEAAANLPRGSVRAKIEKHLQEATHDSEPFSSMVRSFLAAI